MSAIASLASSFTRNLRQSGIYIAFVAIIALFAVMTDGTLLSPGNLSNMILQYSSSWCLPSAW